MGYGIVVTNHGPNAAADVTVTDPAPAGTTIVSAVPTTGACHVEEPIVCRLGDLPVGASVAIAIRVTFTQAGATRDAASVTSPTPDPDLSNNQAQTELTAGVANLVVTKSVAPRRVALGGRLTYAVQVRNGGTATASGVTVTDPVPAGLRVLSATTSAGSCTTIAGRLVCSLGDVAPGQAVTITIHAAASLPGRITNAVSVIAQTPSDPKIVDNASSATAHVGPGRTTLTVSKHASRRSARAGGHVGYRIVVTNTTSRSAHRVLVCDALPVGVVLDHLGGARLRHGRACWSIATLGPHATRTLRLTAVVQGGGATALTNRVTVTAANAPTVRAHATIRRRVTVPRPTPVTG